MTKKEVLAKLAAKFDANREVLRGKLEHLISQPAHHIHGIGPKGEVVDLMRDISETWKEGNAIRELAVEFVPILYPDDAPDTLPAPAQVLQ